MNQRRSFRILETLGKGGFGTVYRAEMTDAGGFSKQVALKVMHYDGDASEDIARRLRDEARVLGFIRHRAIVGVNSLVPLEAGWGVVMEFIDGIDLSSALKAGVPPRGAALEIVEEVAGALDAAYTARAHDTGDPLCLVHRDIKPANIRITRQGEVKLLDFGVARAEFSSREAEEQTGYVMGSVRYMAPERRHGQESHKGDVYGLGIVLANMLTGKRFPEPPDQEVEHSRFVGNVLETVRRSLAESQSEEVRAAQGAVKHLLLEMLAFHPEDRPDANAVMRRCRQIRKSLPPPWLKDWSDANVPRLLRRDQDDEDDQSTGRVLRELSGRGPVIAPPGISKPAPPTSPPRDASDTTLTTAATADRGAGAPGRPLHPAIWVAIGGGSVALLSWLVARFS